MGLVIQRQLQARQEAGCALVDSGLRAIMDLPSP